jgi:hypothetical protein
MSDFDQPGTRRWIIIAFAALAILIFLFALAFLVSGREVTQKPLLIFFILLVWFGTLCGVIVSRRDD